MCLAVPGEIVAVGEGLTATVDFRGVSREVSLALTPSAKAGDYVLVHAGFAIEVVSAESAQETLDLIDELALALDASGGDA